MARFISAILIVISTFACTPSLVVGGQPEKGGNVTEIAFQLFTRNNPTEFQLLKLDDREGLVQSYYNHQLPTKFYAHGWNSDPTKSYGIRDEYLAREALNFIAVDWTSLSTGINYIEIALNNVGLAGDHLAQFIDFLISEGTPTSSLHLFGSSLGAHVVGNAGEAVQQGRIPRITGLDPAGPGFTNNETSRRLDVTDADFVDVIQTNCGDLLDGGLGFGPPLGHIDFYPNGGYFQPGCNDTLCSHRRAIWLFQESINSPDGFRALECTSWDDYLSGNCANNKVVFMGHPTPSDARGVYYLATNPTPPYAQG